MKNIYFLLSVSLLIASCGPTQSVQQSDSYQSAPVEDVSYQSFYDQLSPYGNWVNYPGYGYVWMPNAGPDFRPYATNGNWLYTDAGWTWASNYNWGWAPFHYGRWFFENGYGWIWVPGNEWAPAWVSWRGSGDYYGWAPLGPGISVNVALNNYNPPVNYWNFVPRRYMGNSGGHNYYVNQNQNVTIINNTTIINNYSGTNRSRYAYAPGPDPNEVRRASGNNFTPVQIREYNQPGERISGNQYMIYHPRVSSTPANRGDAPGRPSTPAPARYESFNNVRPSSQYRGNTQPANNQPANNPRIQNPGNTQPNNPQPVNNPRPAMQTPSNPPVNNQPVNNPRNNPSPGGQNPAYNQPVNNPAPVTNPVPANPPVNRSLNDERANGHNIEEAKTHPAPVNQPVNRNLNEERASGHNINQANARTAQPRPTAQPVNPAQTTGRPAATHNPNNGHPVQRSTTPENKPAQKPAEKPANKPQTRDANN